MTIPRLIISWQLFLQNEVINHVRQEVKSRAQKQVCTRLKAASDMCLRHCQEIIMMMGSGGSHMLFVWGSPSF